MSMKTVQIMLVVAAVLCAVGIAAGLSGGGKEIDPKKFRPSGLLESLGGLAGGAGLSRDELERNGRPFPSRLRLDPRRPVTFQVEASPGTDTRRVEFSIGGAPEKRVLIEYRPVDGQKLNGESVEKQNWPDKEAKDVEAPRFVVHDRGGTFEFTNTWRQPATVRMED